MSICCLLEIQLYKFKICNPDVNIYMNKVLIVDASESDRRLMACLLVKSGYEPITAVLRYWIWHYSENVVNLQQIRNRDE